MIVENEYSVESIDNYMENTCANKYFPNRLPKIDYPPHHLAVHPAISCSIMSINDNDNKKVMRSETDQLAVELAEQAVTGSRQHLRSAYNASHNPHHPPASSTMNFSFLTSDKRHRATSALEKLENDRENSANLPPQKRSVLKTMLRKKLAFCLSLFKHLGPVIGLVLYTLFGAAVFHKLEYDNEIREEENSRHLFQTLLKNVCYRAFNLNVTGGDGGGNFSTVAPEIVQNLSGTSATIFNVCERNIGPILKNYVKQYIRGFEGDGKDWDLMGSAFFAITVYTTIGYGVTVPTTDYGRVAMIVYAMIGIPLNFFVVADLGILLNRGIRKLWAKIANYLEKSKVRQSTTEPVLKKKKKALPLWVALLISYTYLFVGAALFMYEEPKWNFLTAMYFCFQTFATIGFGDVMPENRENLMLSTIYILVGMALLSMCMAIITDNIKKHYVKYSKHLIILQQPSSAPPSCEIQTQDKVENLTKSTDFQVRESKVQYITTANHQQLNFSKRLQTADNQPNTNQENESVGSIAKLKTLFLSSKFSIFKK